MQKQSSLLHKKNDCEVRDASTQTTVEMGMAARSASSRAMDQNVDEKDSKWSAASGTVIGRSLADEVKKVAESAMQQTGFVYEETSGMYYDYNTGYYYNAVSNLLMPLWLKTFLCES